MPLHGALSFCFIKNYKKNSMVSQSETLKLPTAIRRRAKAAIATVSAGNALAMLFNYRWLSKKVHLQGVGFFQARGYTGSMPNA